ncbi:MAG: hypothetical protein IJJ33_03140 [Victivallales bacterium]|nr:hypothetical protein [Victivallales bacterium]
MATQVIECGLTCTQGNPYLDQGQKRQLDSATDRLAKMPLAPLLWVDNTYTPISMENELPFSCEWEQYPRQRHVGTEATYSLVCPCPAWHNFYLHGISELLKNERLKGFYLDMTGYGSCRNRYHGCGYEENGESLGEVPILELRALFLKFWNVTHLAAPGNLILQHAQVLTPCALWTDVITQGENWTAAKKGGERGYQTLSLPYYQLAFMPQRQYGVQFNWFATLNMPTYVHDVKAIVSLEEVVGLSLLHDNLPIGVTSQQIPGLVACWNAMKEFGAYEKDCRWSPYWENGLGDWKHGVAVSYYRRNEGFLVAAFNTSYNEVLTVDLPGGLFGHGTAQNVLTGQEERFHPLSIRPRKTKMLVIRR